MRSSAVSRHYDALIDENNDSFHDSPELAAYMDKWDGQKLLDMLAPKAEQTVLEIGVGTGRLARRTAPLYQSFTGIDLSEKTVERAKSNLASFPNVTLYCDNFLTYPFEERFDTVYSSLTFMHIRQKQRAFEKVSTLLVPGGRFVLSIDKNTGKYLVCGDRTLALYPDTPNEIEKIALDVGFRITEKAQTAFAHIYVFE